MNHTLRAKQQKSNLDKLDKILASLPEAQYDHSEEDSSAKKRGRPQKSASDSVKKSGEKKAAKKDTEKQNPEKKNSGWNWNKKKRGSDFPTSRTMRNKYLLFKSPNQ